MDKNIVTDPLGAEDLWSDFRLNIDLLKKLDIAEVLVMFGFSWGNKIYTGRWQDISMTVSEVETSVVDAESNGFGKLGDDNLYITIPLLKARLTYSYETDIHLAYAEENDFVRKVKARWSKNDWLIESERSTTYHR